MPKPAVLIVDDEPDLCELLSITLQRMDLNPRTANDVATAQRMPKSVQDHLDTDPAYLRLLIQAYRALGRRAGFRRARVDQW